MAIDLRVAESDADLEAWRQVRLAVLPNGRTRSVAEMRAMATPEILYLIAEVDGRLAGSGLAGRSSFAYAGLHPRVLPVARRRGVGTALLKRLADHAIGMGFTEAGTLVDDEGSMAFAERFGFREVDRQIEQVRSIGAEPMPRIPDEIRVVTVAERPDLWQQHALTAVARPWRRQGIASMLKRMTLAFAAANGVREVYTWTQLGNADMRALNERLGYETRGVSITVRAPLPLQRS